MQTLTTKQQDQLLTLPCPKDVTATKDRVILDKGTAGRYSLMQIDSLINQWHLLGLPPLLLLDETESVEDKLAEVNPVLKLLETEVLFQLDDKTLSISEMYKNWETYPDHIFFVDNIIYRLTLECLKDEHDIITLELPIKIFISFSDIESEKYTVEIGVDDIWRDRLLTVVTPNLNMTKEEIRDLLISHYIERDHLRMFANIVCHANNWAEMILEGSPMLEDDTFLDGDTESLFLGEAVTNPLEDRVYLESISEGDFKVVQPNETPYRNKLACPLAQPINLIMDGEAPAFKGYEVRKVKSEIGMEDTLIFMMTDKNEDVNIGDVVRDIADYYYNPSVNTLLEYHWGRLEYEQKLFDSLAKQWFPEETLKEELIEAKKKYYFGRKSHHYPRLDRYFQFR